MTLWLVTFSVLLIYLRTGTPLIGLVDHSAAALISLSIWICIDPMFKPWLVAWANDERRWVRICQLIVRAFLLWKWVYNSLLENKAHGFSLRITQALALASCGFDWPHRLLKSQRASCVKISVYKRGNPCDSQLSLWLTTDNTNNLIAGWFICIW